MRLSENTTLILKPLTIKKQKNTQKAVKRPEATNKFSKMPIHCDLLRIKLILVE